MCLRVGNEAVLFFLCVTYNTIRSSTILLPTDVLEMYKDIYNNLFHL